MSNLLIENIFGMFFSVAFLTLTYSKPMWAITFILLSTPIVLYIFTRRCITIQKYVRSRIEVFLWLLGVLIYWDQGILHMIIPVGKIYIHTYELIIAFEFKTIIFLSEVFKNYNYFGRIIPYLGFYIFYIFLYFSCVWISVLVTKFIFDGEKAFFRRLYVDKRKTQLDDRVKRKYDCLLLLFIFILGIIYYVC